MDADTRHSLRQNELAEALARLKEFNDRRALFLLVVVAAGVLLYAGYRLRQWQNRQHLASGWWTLVTRVDTQNPAQDEPIDRLRELLNTHEQPGLEAASRLRLGATLRRKALLTGDKQALGQAIEVLDASVEDPATPREFRAAALYVLALAHEDRREFDEARPLYERLADSDGFAGSAFQDLAAERLESMEEYEEAVAFEPGFALDIPALAPSTAPTTAPIFSEPSAVPAPEGNAPVSGEHEAQPQADTPGPEAEPNSQP
jgi:tetratricopeptide (TPR) repeat protein